MMKQRVLVTGGAGFIGSHVVDELVAEGHDVRVLDCVEPHSHASIPGYLNPKADYVWSPLHDEWALEVCLSGATAVTHQAAMVGLGTDFADVTEYVHHNGLGTAALLRAMHRTGFPGRLILASSMVVYGEGRYRCIEHGPTRPRARSKEDLSRGRFDPRCPTCQRPLVPSAVSEEDAADPRSVYAATKLHQEHLCTLFARRANLPLAVLRYHNAYGPRMPRDSAYAGVASIFRTALEEGEAPQVFEDGRQLRDFVHVRDVAHANVLALTMRQAVAGTFNVASGSPHTVGEMAHALVAAFGLGAAAPVITGRFRLEDVRHVFASTQLAATALRFQASVSFQEGMRELATAPLRSGLSFRTHITT